MASSRLRIAAASIAFFVSGMSVIWDQFVSAARNGWESMATAQSTSITSTPQRNPIAVDSKIMESKLLKKVDPVYPELALRARLEGVVRLSLMINEKGDVTDVKIIGGGYPPLQPAAAEAARQWRYSPWLDENGNPVPVTTTASVTFKLPSATPAKGQSSESRDQDLKPLPVDSKIMESKLLKKVDPVYPELALRARLEGVVRLSLMINAKGEVTDVKIIGGGYPPLQPAAAEAARQWRYSPWLDENGNPVPVTTTASVTFKLPSATPAKVSLPKTQSE